MVICFASHRNQHPWQSEPVSPPVPKEWLRGWSCQTDSSLQAFSLYPSSLCPRPTKINLMKFTCTDSPFTCGFCLRLASNGSWGQREREISLPYNPFFAKPGWLCLLWRSWLQPRMPHLQFLHPLRCLMTAFLHGESPATGACWGGLPVFLVFCNSTHSLVYNLVIHFLVISLKHAICFLPGHRKHTNAVRQRWLHISRGQWQPCWEATPLKQKR